MLSIPSLLLLLTAGPIVIDGRGARVKRIVGGSPAEPPPVDDPVVYTNFNGKAARVQGIIANPHYHFRGIKYGHPPVGEYRFLRPRQKFLEGFVNATTYSPPCVQQRPGTDIVVGHEDCLAVNVFTPELPRGMEGLPVVVWIHGGGFRYGSASQYGVRHLVGKRLVVVTVQYRLGSLGFLSTGDKNLPGNAALWDMALAVQWVRNYIGFFGGNPYKINVMGHDTGASSAILLALSNIAKGYPSGIIAMSGTAVSQWAIDNTPQNTAKEVAEKNGCPTTDSVTMVKCLQTTKAEYIVLADADLEFKQLQMRGFMNGLSGQTGAAPVTEGYNDGRSLPGLVEGDPLVEMNKQTHPKIPLLTGICKHETKRAIEGPFKKEITKNLKEIPNFVDEVIVKNLRALLPVERIQQDINNTLNLLPLNFGSYIRHDTKNLLESLDKISEITSDALFNLPAFLTVNRWSNNGAHTFLYSFDHVGKRSKGKVFLTGSLLVGNGTDDNAANPTVGHGDDLAYIFDAQDIMGEPLETSDAENEEDEIVRNVFTEMVADFARHGVPKVQSLEVSPFSQLKNNFIQIKPKPTLAKDFRFCEMALWFNIADRLKSSSCKFLNAFDAHIKNTVDMVNNAVNNTLLNPLLNGKPPGAGGGGLLPGILSNTPDGNGNKMERNLLGGNSLVPGLLSNKPNINGNDIGRNRLGGNGFGMLGSSNSQNRSNRRIMNQPAPASTSTRNNNPLTGFLGL